MITIIHGDDIVTSRKYFLEQKGKELNSFVFDGEKLEFSELIQILDGGELFKTSKTIFIEDFFSRRKPGKEVDGIVSYLKEKPSSNVFFWERKEIGKKNLSVFPKSVVKLFKLPQTLFLFLERIKPGNGKNLILLFHKTLTNVEVELIFYMLIRQLRMLLALSDQNVRADKQLDEIKRLAPWQKSKMQKQASLFSQERLKGLYKKLYETDLAQKTGASSLSLIQSLDFLLLEI